MAIQSGGKGIKTKSTELNYSIFGRGGKHPSIVFTIGSKLWNDMRWILGDRIDVLYDPSLAEGQLVRCKEGGWQLTDCNNAHSPARVRLAFREEYGMPNTEERVDLAVEMTENTICFAFPTRFRTGVKVCDSTK